MHDTESHEGPLEDRRADPLPHREHRTSQEAPRFGRSTRRAFTFVGAAAAVLVLLAFLDAVTSVLLLLFAGALLATFLGGLAARLSQHTPLSHGWALALVVPLLAGAIGLASWYLAPDLATQADQLAEAIPAAVEEVEGWLSRYAWGRALADEVPSAREAVGGVGNLWGRVTGVFSRTLSLLATVLLVVVLGIYLAANPGLYRRGALLLVPIRRRERAGEVLDAVYNALWGWITGQLVSMAVVGALVWGGLSLVGVPLSLALGLVAGASEFVPYVGPWIGSVPGVLVALAASPTKALYAGLVYLAVQQLESYVITPLVMKRAVALPPALTVAATVLGGALFGPVGVLLATPLVVVAMVLVRALYVRDFLGDASVEPLP
jgi:predicted PurR-regulated permease PerM